MVKTRIILIVISAALIWGIFQLPKVVVNNDESSLTPDSGPPKQSMGVDSVAHVAVPENISKSIKNLRALYLTSARQEKNAIFADSLASLYSRAGKFDSAAWFAGEAASFFNTPESWTRAGDQYYQAYTFALDEAKQQDWAEKARNYYTKVLEAEPGNLNVKTRMAMTYLSAQNPMQGIQMLREVLAEDPENQEAIFNLGMLSVQSGQYDKAIERLEKLIRLNPEHVQGHLLLGIALMNSGEKERARQQFEKVKEIDRDPAVQATVDSYLKDLK